MDKEGKDEKALKIRSSKSTKIKSKTNVPAGCFIHFANVKETNITVMSETSFQKIKAASDLRQSMAGNDRLDDICSNIPSKFLPARYGYHRSCYQRFTNVSRLVKRKKPESSSNSEPGPDAVKRRRLSGQSTSTSSRLMPADRCLFCDKNRIRKSGKEEHLVKCVTKTAEDSIKRASETKQDEDILLKIQGIDLVAKEAHYHASCRKNFTRSVNSKEGPKEQEANEHQAAMKAAHKAAFENLCEHVNTSIISGGNVERMSMLRERYLAYILQNRPDCYNPDYKTDKLKSKLVKQFGSSIQFWQPNYRSELVYSSDIKTGEAIGVAFEAAASETKRLEEAALILRRAIQSAHIESEEMPWPPSADFLVSDNVLPPLCLQEFLSSLLAVKNDSSVSRQRLISSFAQDICKAVTNGQWTMAKHLLLGMTLRHLTGSAEIVTLINRFGHCASYSRVLELETAMCKAIDEQEGVIPSTINPNMNAVTHLCWDNFDLREETPSGAGTTHTAHGIIIQEVSEDVRNDTATPTTSDQPRTKGRSVRCSSEDIEPCFAKGKAEPQVTVSTTEVVDAEVETEAQLSDALWFLCRLHYASRSQIVPPWAGWVSLTETRKDSSTQQSTVDYMAPVFAPVTENATIQHILQLSQQASREVNQQYTVVTFDLAVAKKAYSLVWQNPEMFSDVIVRMGSFHLTCSYMGALGKKMKCSGLEEILIESGICASGSIAQVMSGKHYNRALRVHKIVYEALERLLLKMYESLHGHLVDEEGTMKLDRLAREPCKETLLASLASESCKKSLDHYREFKESVRQGKHGKTAQFWLSYMDKVCLILRFQRATKQNNLMLHLASLQKMCSLFFSFDHPNYARYSTLYLLIMLNLENSHPGAEELLKRNGFSVNRSDVPSSRNAVDITIEQTINRHAKSHGGIVGFSRNLSAYYRWCRTRHTRASYLQATKEIASMDSQEATSHKEVRGSQIVKSEQDTCSVLQAISNFTNPFTIEDKDALYCLSSGAPVPEDVESDILMADDIGKKAHREFVQERLVEKKTSFHAPVKKQNLKTFGTQAKSSKVCGKERKNIEITAERNVFGQLVILALEHQVSLENVLSYPLGPVPWALATADGALIKTDKSKLMHSLEEESHLAQRPAVAYDCYIIDGNAVLQAMVSLPSTFGELAECVFDQLPRAKRVDFVTDSYHPCSIKGVERSRRGSAKAHLVKGPSTKVPRDWKRFLCNEVNKRRLCSFLLEEWKKNKYAWKLNGKSLIVVNERSCISLRSLDGKSIISEEIEELCSSQEEADTRIILHCKHVAANSPNNSAILIRSPDTDVFILLLRFARQISQTVLFDTGTGDKRRLLNIHAVAGDLGVDVNLALAALHAFTGCDTTSAFVRKGKVTPLKLLKKHPEFLPTFHALGTSIDVADSVFEDLEKFTCLMYGSKSADINSLRHEKFIERFSTKPGMVLTSYDGVDVSLLPPCRASLRMHIRRANYQTLIWKKADEPTPSIPGPDGHGWTIDNNGQLEICWTAGNLMPQELADVIASPLVTPDDEDDSSPDYDNMSDTVFESVDLQ